MAHGGGYNSLLTGDPTAFQPPGWPMVLAGWFWVAHHTPLSDDVWTMAGVLNVAIAAASMVLLFAIGRRLFDARTGLLAAGTYALWPNLVYYTGIAALELFFVFLVLLVIWLLLHYGWPDGPRLPWTALVLCGLATGVTLLVRPFGVAVLVAMFVAGLIARRGLRRVALEVAVVTLVGLVVIVPWTIRNAVQLDGFVPFATGLGETFCIGHQPGATGGPMADSRYCVGDLDTTQITRPHLEIDRNNHALRQGLKFAAGHPVDEARLLFWRGFYMLKSDHDGVDAVESRGAPPPFSFIPERPRAVLVTLGDAWFFVVGALALFALPAFVRGRDGRRWLFLLAGVGLLLVPLELFGIPRYKVPVEPFLALGAAVTVARLTVRR
jgi:4-amino-4-deoxy-L-arabinose transferase-like glycosyltransferase